VDPPVALVPSLAGVVLLAAVATAVLALVRVPRIWTPAWAIVRGGVQLAVLSVILTGVLADPVWIGVALATMYVAAVGVATGRVGWSWRRTLVNVAAIGAGLVVTAGIVFGVGALEWTPRYVLAYGAITIGAAMAVATLTGRRLISTIGERWDEVEGWLALGAPSRVATRGLARRSIAEALIPSIDQTRTTGLVVLPGAFVGAIFGGLSPLEAGRFQLLVLAGILASGATTAAIVATALGAVRVRPVAPR
jgi:putative ABC transport system permease protein